MTCLCCTFFHHHTWAECLIRTMDWGGWLETLLWSWEFIDSIGWIHDCNFSSCRTFFVVAACVLRFFESFVSVFLFLFASKEGGICSLSGDICLSPQKPINNSDSPHAPPRNTFLPATPPQFPKKSQQISKGRSREREKRQGVGGGGFCEIGGRVGIEKDFFSSFSLSLSFSSWSN